MGLQPIVHIDGLAYRKIIHWMKKAGSYEISGLGNVVYDHEKHMFRVTDVYLLEQENTGASTDINEKAVGKLMYQHHLLQKSGEVEGELRFWWHSHVDMGVFWSGTDRETIEQLGQGGWFLSTVFNKKEEMKSCVFMTDPMKLFSDDLPTYIESPASEDKIKKALAKIGLQVREGSMNDILWGTEPIAQDGAVEEWDEEYKEKVKEKYATVSSYAGLGLGMGGQVSHNPLGGSGISGVIDRINPSNLKEPFPDFVSRSQRVSDLEPEEIAEIIDEIEDMLAHYPRMTRQEIIEMFEDDYPDLDDVLPENFGCKEEDKYDSL
jgi:hypothetical protein